MGNTPPTSSSPARALENDALSSSSSPPERPARSAEAAAASSAIAARTPLETLVERVFGGSLEGEDTVPFVFRWEGGGEEVSATGSFVDWSESLPMVRSGNDFVAIRELARERHAYVYLVDHETRFASHEPTRVSPRDGSLHNCVDLREFRPQFEDLSRFVDPERARRENVVDARYGHVLTGFSEYVEEPKRLPTTLPHTVPSLPRGSPENPVSLDHLYSTPRDEGIVRTSLHHRLGDKVVSVVLYSPALGGFPVVLRTRVVVLPSGRERVVVVPERVALE